MTNETNHSEAREKLLAELGRKLISAELEKSRPPFVRHLPSIGRKYLQAADIAKQIYNLDYSGMIPELDDDIVGLAGRLYTTSFNSFLAHSKSFFGYDISYNLEEITRAGAGAVSNIGLYQPEYEMKTSRKFLRVVKNAVSYLKKRNDDWAKEKLEDLHGLMLSTRRNGLPYPHYKKYKRLIDEISELMKGGNE